MFLPVSFEKRKKLPPSGVWVVDPSSHLCMCSYSSCETGVLLKEVIINWQAFLFEGSHTAWGTNHTLTNTYINTKSYLSCRHEWISTTTLRRVRVLNCVSAGRTGNWRSVLQPSDHHNLTMNKMAVCISAKPLMCRNFYTCSNFMLI